MTASLQATLKSYSMEIKLQPASDGSELGEIPPKKKRD